MAFDVKLRASRDPLREYRSVYYSLARLEEEPMVAFAQADADHVSGDPIAHALDNLRQACDAAVTQLRATEGWADTDARVVCIHRLRNVAQSLLAAFVFHRVVFPSASFWQTFFQAVPVPADMANHYREFDVLVRFVGLQGMFSAAESDLRAIVNRLDPAACGGATAEFASITAWLFARATSAAHFAPFVELLRLTRNTIHTNGVHRPRKVRTLR